MMKTSFIFLSLLSLTSCHVFQKKHRLASEKDSQLLLPKIVPVQTKSMENRRLIHTKEVFEVNLSSQIFMNRTVFQDPFNQVSFSTLPTEYSGIFFDHVPGRFLSPLSPLAHSVSSSIVQDRFYGAHSVAFRYFSSPLDNPNSDVLKKRRAMIQKFLDNPDLLQKTLISLEHFKKHEPVLIVLLAGYNGHYQSANNFKQVIDRIGVENLLPRDVTYLNSTEYRQIMDIIFNFSSFVSAVSVQAQGLAFAFNNNILPILGGALDFVESLVPSSKNKNLSSPKVLKKKIESEENLTIDPSRVDLRGLGISLFLLTKYIRFNGISKDFKSIIEGLQSLFGFTFENREMFEYMRPNVQNMMRQIEQYSEHFKQVLADKHRKDNPVLIFLGKQQEFSQLVNIFDIQSKNNALQDWYLDIAEIGFAAFLADILKKSKLPYHFVSEFSETDTITLRNFWHLSLFNDPNVVTQEFSSNKITILHSPNASGKTTYANGVLLALLSAHTLGLVPADSSQIPFIKNFFMNRPADSNFSREGLSQFNQEMVQLQELFLFLNDLDQRERSFILLDEPFVQTRPFYAGLLDIYIAALLTNSPYTHGFLISHHAEVLAFKHPRVQKGQMAFELEKNEHGVPTKVIKKYTFVPMNEDKIYPLNPTEQSFIEKGFLLEVSARIPEVAIWLEEFARMHRLEIR